MSDSNVELQLKKLNGESVDLPEPRSRVELFLAKLNDESVDLPEPQSRVEELLYKLSQKPGDDGSSAFVDAIVRALTGELVDIVLPSKFDALTAIPEDDVALYLPETIRSISSESATVLSNNLCIGTLLESIDFPKVTLIGTETFYNCTKLTEVLLPSVEQVNDNAFGNCTSLESLVLPSLKRVGSTIFQGSTKLATLKTGALTETQEDSFKISSRGSASSAVLSNVEIGEGTSADLYLQYSNAYSQEVLHNIIANLADLSDAETPGEFCIGDVNMEKIDDEYIAMLERKNWNYT